MEETRMPWSNQIKEIARRRDAARRQGGESAVVRQHARGRLTIRERVEGLLDPGSFREIGPITGASDPDDPASFTPANFVLGFGKIDARPVIAGGEDFTINPCAQPGRPAQEHLHRGTGVPIPPSADTAA